jgi:protein-L-isoaspartate(D-aspartate) O-methyltransferase
MRFRTFTECVKMDNLQFQAERLEMVKTQIQYRGITDKRVLDAMRQVPRHRFVPEEYQDEAYEDHPIPIGRGQTISQPYIVALMTTLLELKGEETVLEVGTGSGYQSAVLAHLACKVYTIEYIPELYKAAKNVLRSLSINNVEVLCADGSNGYPVKAPYSGILVTAAAPEPPESLFNQLKLDGRLVIPVGGPGVQYLQVWTQQNGSWQAEIILAVAFVPLRGEAGWTSSEWL